MIDLRLGDALAILPTLPDASVDAIITDPPYGTDSPRDGYGRRSLGGPTKRIVGDDDLATARAMLSLAPRLLKPFGFVLTFCSPKRHAEAAFAVAESGLKLFGEIVWDKKCPGLGGGLRYQHELILICGTRKPRGRSSLFSILRYATRKAGRLHPHEKPVGLMVDLVKYACPVGGIVCDPFMGSGSTAEACLGAGRDFFGIEIDPGYFAVAERRVAGASTQEAA